MKTILLLSLFIFSTAYGATCTTTSRTNFSVGQVLTSSALNSDLNQLVTKVNGLDGGCVTDGSLEAAALNSTDFAAVTNGIHQGCAVSYSDANTVSVDKCILSVNGAFVKTATASTVTWGCTSCASEVVSTQYYVYAKTGSTGTTLNLLISTTAPNGDGYDSLGDKILGSFYNNASSAIDQFSPKSWASNGFYQPQKLKFSFYYYSCSGASCLFEQHDGGSVISFARSSAGVYTVTTNKTWSSLYCTYSLAVPTTFAPAYGVPSPDNAGPDFSIVTRDGSGVVAESYGMVSCEGY